MSGNIRLLHEVTFVQNVQLAQQKPALFSSYRLPRQLLRFSSDVIGGVVLVAVIIALLVGGTGTASSPEQTIGSFYKEAERLNASKLADLLVEEHRVGWTMGMEWTFAAIDSFSISNLTIPITSQTQDAAEAVADYGYTYRLKDGSVYTEEHEEDHIELTRVGNKWLIQETDFFFGRINHVK